MAQSRTADVSEAEIAVHWQEEDYATRLRNSLRRPT